VDGVSQDKPEPGQCGAPGTAIYLYLQGESTQSNQIKPARWPRKKTFALCNDMQ
jgi:hypothetical protein